MTWDEKPVCQLLETHPGRGGGRMSATLDTEGATPPTPCRTLSKALCRSYRSPRVTHRVAIVYHEGCLEHEMNRCATSCQQHETCSSSALLAPEDQDSEGSGQWGSRHWGVRTVGDQDSGRWVRTVRDQDSGGSGQLRVRTVGDPSFTHSSYSSVIFALVEIEPRTSCMARQVLYH